MAWLSGVKFIFPGTAFATRERRFCVIPRYRFRYWEPGVFSVPGPAVFRPSPWYRFRYYSLYFHLTSGDLATLHLRRCPQRRPRSSRVIGAQPSRARALSE